MLLTRLLAPVLLALSMCASWAGRAADVIPLPAAPGGTLLQSFTQTITTPRFSGTFRWSSYDGPEPGFNIDFYWQFSNDATSLEEVAMLSAGDPIAFPATYGLFQTPGPFGIFRAGTRTPQSGRFGSPPLEIDFAFLFDNPLLPGETSNILIARTTAQQYFPRVVVGIASPFSIANISAPLPPIPEPGTLALVTAGLLGLGWRYRSRNAGGAYAR